MIKSLEKSARTEEEAVNLALAELGLDRDDVSVEILTRSKSGFLGIGACNAVVKVSYEVPDPKPEKIEKAPAPKPEKKPSEKKAEQKTAKPAAKQDNKPAQPKAEPVKVAAPVNPDEPAEYAAIRSFLSGLLEKMGVKADIEIGPRADADGQLDPRLHGSERTAVHHADLREFGERALEHLSVEHAAARAARDGDNRHVVADERLDERHPGRIDVASAESSDHEAVDAFFAFSQHL